METDHTKPLFRIPTMESVVLTALTSLADTASRWYCIETGPEDPHSLSGLLCITKEELDFMLMELKWVRMRRKKGTSDVTYQFCNDKVISFYHATSYWILLNGVKEFINYPETIACV